MTTRNRAGGRLKVAWLAPVDLRPMLDRFNVPLGGGFPNAPWIANGARALVERGTVDLHIITYHKRVDRDYEFVADGVTYHVLRAPFPAVPRPLAAYRLDRPGFFDRIRRVAPDLVHGHGTENLYSYVAVEAGLPNVVSMQAVVGWLASTHTRVTRAALEQHMVKHIERLTLRRAAHVLIEAPFVESFVKNLNPRAVVRVLGNIVTDDFFKVARSGTSSRRLTFVGRLAQTKGVEEAVLAFHRIISEYPDATLDLIGEGPTGYVGGRLSELIAGGPGADRITRRGHLPAPEIARLHASAAALLLPTYYDTSPNAVSEAQVAGVPVIATRVGGLPYMLQDGEAGALVPVRDVAALAASIRECFEDPARANARARVGQTLARKRYHKTTFVDGLLAMYDSALGESFRSRRHHYGG